MPVAEGPVGPFPAGSDAEAYDRLRRRVLWSMPTGLFVVGSRSGERRNLMACNWAMQVATAPKLVAVALESTSVTLGLVAASGSFALSVLPRAERVVIRKFVKPVRDVELGPDGGAIALQGQPVIEVAGGLPVLAVAQAWLAFEVRTVERWSRPDGAEGSHRLVVGEVVDVGEVAPAADEVALTMADTTMHYGG